MVAPRTSVRLFPDADQLNVVSGTIVNQSRITFSGQAGLVWCAWKVDFEKDGVVDINQVTAAFNASFSPVLGGTGVGAFPGQQGNRMGLWAFAFVQDPPENSFIEMRVLLSGNQVDVLANQSVAMAMSFEAGVGAGPTVALG